MTTSTASLYTANMELVPERRRVFDFREIAEEETPGAEHQLSALLDRCFPVPPTRHFLDDFPIWSRAVPGEVLRFGIYEDKQRLVASIGLRFAQLRTPAGLLKIALIGAV